MNSLHSELKQSQRVNDELNQELREMQQKQMEDQLKLEDNQAAFQRLQLECEMLQKYKSELDLLKLETREIHTHEVTEDSGTEHYKDFNYLMELLSVQTNLNRKLREELKEVEKKS